MLRLAATLFLVTLSQVWFSSQLGLTYLWLSIVKKSALLLHDHASLVLQANCFVCIPPITENFVGWKGMCLTRLGSRGTCIVSTTQIGIHVILEIFVSEYFGIKFCSLG